MFTTRRLSRRLEVRKFLRQHHCFVFSYPCGLVCKTRVQLWSLERHWNEAHVARSFSLSLSLSFSLSLSLFHRLQTGLAGSSRLKHEREGQYSVSPPGVGVVVAFSRAVLKAVANKQIAVGTIHFRDAARVLVIIRDIDEGSRLGAAALSFRGGFPKRRPHARAFPLVLARVDPGAATRAAVQAGLEKRRELFAPRDQIGQHLHVVLGLHRDRPAGHLKVWSAVRPRQVGVPRVLHAGLLLGQRRPLRCRRGHQRPRRSCHLVPQLLGGWRLEAGGWRRPDVLTYPRGAGRKSLIDGSGFSDRHNMYG
jgi:hypothetical protein